MYNHGQEAKLIAKKTFFPVSSGLLASEHIQAIGPAIWLFLWLIDKTTSEEVRDGCRWGIVLYGKPLASAAIAAQLAMNPRTCRRYLELLESKGYISTARTNSGQTIWSVNPSSGNGGRTLAGIVAINDQDIASFYEKLQRANQARSTGRLRRDEVSKREAAQTEKARIEQLERCGIFARYQDSTFANIEARGIPAAVRSQYTEIKRWLDKLDQHLRTGEGLILRGHVGTMKTTFAAAALQELIRQGGAGFFITMPSLIDTVFTLKEKNSEEWLAFEQKLRDRQLLVLDDLGAEYPTGWVLHKIDAIISERYNRRRPIIITTNLSGEQMKATYAERIIDRLRSTCRIITFTGDSLRKTVSD